MDQKEIAFEQSAKQRLNLLSGLVWGSCALVILAALVSVLTGRYMIAYMVLGGIIAIAFVSHPKLAMVQFILLLFFRFVVIPEIPILIQDLSALILVMAALTDLLVNNQIPVHLPRLSFSFLLFLATLVLAASFSYDPTRAIRPIIRLLVMVAVFLSVFRLSSKFEIATLLKIFYWSCVAHSVVVVVPFILSGGTLRSFGFAHAVFDDLAMLALPMGIALWLWSDEGKGKRYAISALIVVAALLATQSRVPIVLAFAGTLFVVLQAYIRGRVSFKRKLRWPLISKRASARAGVLFGFVIVTFILGIALRVDIFTGVLARFERLLSPEPGGTFLLRLTLWKMALMAFWDHPIVGIGPGIFKTIYEMYPSVRLEPDFINVRGLSAHNPVLHYLAETGIPGGFAMILLFVNQYRVARKTLRLQTDQEQMATSFALYIIAVLLLVSTLFESAWLWGQLSFVAAFFLAIIVRHYCRIKNSKPVVGYSHQNTAPPFFSV